MTHLLACRLRAGTHRLAAAAVALLLAAPLAGSPPQSQPPPRIVAVGDVHGDLEAFRSILRQAELTDEAHRWKGGGATFVQTGDYTDRGAQVRGVMDLLMALERDAPAAGGRALILLGNHETMNLIGDTRDVTPEIFATFADAKSEQRREEAYKTYERVMAGSPEFGVVDKTLAPPSVSKEDWMKAHPPGFIEYYEALAPRGKYGEWLRKHDPLGRVGDSLFMHAGINPDTAPAKAEDVNAKVRDEVKRFDDIRKTLVDAKIAAPWFTLGELLEVSRHYLTLTQRPGGTELVPAQPAAYKAMLDLNGIGEWAVVNGDGPMWFRGFAQWPEADGAPLAAKLLQQYGAARFVTGHTPQATGRITPRFENRVFLIDTGMLASVYKGRPSALEIKDPVITAIYTDRRDVLVKQ